MLSSGAKRSGPEKRVGKPGKTSSGVADSVAGAASAGTAEEIECWSGEGDTPWASMPALPSDAGPAILPAAAEAATTSGLAR